MCALYDVDKTSPDRGVPKPNTHDTLETLRMAHGTLSHTPVTAATENEGFSQTRDASYLVNDGTNNRIRLGLQSDNTFGLRVSQRGKDVDTADAADILFSSDQSAYRVVQVNAQLNSNGLSDNPDIQAAIDQVASEGGGQVLLKNDTYLMSSDIVIPNNVILAGETIQGVVIDFQNQDFQIRAQGTLIDNTGTVSATNASDQVIGTNTVFDSAWLGATILLSGRWFIITAVTDQNTLTINQPFDEDSFTSQNTIVSIPTQDVQIRSLTVQNSSHTDGAVYMQYVYTALCEDVFVYNSVIGLNFDACNLINLLGFACIQNGIGLYANNSSTWTVKNFAVYASAGDNAYFNSAYNISFSNGNLTLATGNNLTLINCSSWGIYDNEITTCFGSGVSLTSSLDIEMFAMVVRSCGEGVTLISGNQRTSFHNITFKNNYVYGLDIVDPTNDHTTISACFFIGNGGDINDQGTNTIIIDGQGLRYIDVKTQTVTKNNGTTSQTFSFPHDLSFVPAYLAYVTLVSGTDRVPYLSIDTVTGAVLLAIYVSIDTTNVNITVVTPGSNADSGPWSIRYYLLQQSAT